MEIFLKEGFDVTEDTANTVADVDNRNYLLLVKKAAKHNSYIVTTNHIECEKIAQFAHKNRFNIPYPMTFHDFLAGKYYGVGVKSFIFDQVDVLIRTLARGARVPCITFSDYCEIKSPL